MLINLSNHPSTQWPAEQIDAAKLQFAQVVDLPFPQIDPVGDEAYIQILVDDYLKKIKQLATENGSDKPTVHIMGELTFCFVLVQALHNQGVDCVASTTERIVHEENGVKTSEFRFVKFRRYI